MRPPQPKDLSRLRRAANDNIRLITLAPEVEGTREVIREATRAGIGISLGHTNASVEQIESAIESGTRFCTHLGNGVPLEMHRHDNIMQRLLHYDELTAFFIPDGIHLPPFLLRNLWRAKPAGRALLTTDCMAAAGAPPGRYRIGSIETEVGANRIVHEPGKKSFAGSALAPDEGVANAQRWLDLPEEEAEAAFSTLPARHFDIELP